MTNADITWKQLSIMTKMACGAREPISYDDGRNLRFKVGSKPMRYVEVELDPNDTYTVRSFRVKRSSYDRVVLEEHSGVYVDVLSETVYGCVNK